MPGIVLTVAQAVELLPLACQQLSRAQLQQDAANQKGIPKRGTFRYGRKSSWPYKARLLMGWFMSPDLFVAVTYGLLILFLVTLGLLFGFLLLRREQFPRRGSVNSCAPGLSEHVPPFGQTEARAERTIERPPDESLGVILNCHFSCRYALSRLMSTRRVLCNTLIAILMVTRGKLRILLAFRQLS